MPIHFCTCDRSDGFGLGKHPMCLRRSTSGSFNEERHRANPLRRAAPPAVFAQACELPPDCPHRGRNGFPSARPQVHGRVCSAQSTMIPLGAFQARSPEVILQLPDLPPTLLRTAARYFTGQDHDAPILQDGGMAGGIREEHPQRDGDFLEPLRLMHRNYSRAGSMQRCAT